MRPSNSSYWLLIGLLALTGSSSAGSPPVDPLSKGTHTTTESQTSLPIVPDLRKTPHQRASLWGLTDADWQRYRTLMRGIRGSVSPANLSPVEVLGIHARSTEERNRYAERWAVMMRDDAERILAFQQAYTEAQQRLFPNSLLIDKRKLPIPGGGPDSLRPTDRVLFFTEPGCVACDALFEQLQRKLDRIAGVDVYLLNVPSMDEQVIRDWALSRNIDPEQVSRRAITLNFDAGALRSLSDTPDQLPQMMLRRDAQLLPLRRLD